jgi:hypothetical protein
MSDKCCKTPICKPNTKKCGSNVEFYEDPAFWKFLLFLNVLIILIRYNYIKSKDKNFNLLLFLLWLELQIIVFFIVLIAFIFVARAIIYLVGLFFYYFKALFSTRKTPKIMKYLNLKNTDEVLFRLYCIFGMFISIFFILFILGSYIALFFFAVTYLLGYTKI